MIKRMDRESRSTLMVSGSKADRYDACYEALEGIANPAAVKDVIEEARVLCMSEECGGDPLRVKSLVAALAEIDKEPEP